MNTNPMNQLTVAHLSPDRKSVVRLARMTEAELAAHRAADTLGARLVVPVTTPQPRPIGVAVDVRMTIREDDVLREYIPKPSILRAQLAERIPQRRWEVETGGIEVGGLLVATNERAQGMVGRLAARASRDKKFTTRFKTAAGWMPVNAAQLIEIDNAVANHVNAAFLREEQLAAMLAAAADADLPALVHAVEAFWPAK